MARIRLSKSSSLYFLFWSACLMIFASGIERSSAPAREQTNDVAPPFVYYYSNTDQAWVIERADGTERHLFGKGIMVEAENSIAELHWSPSGAYLAWGSQYLHAVPNHKPTRVRISRTDGTPIDSLVDDVFDSLGMVWIPGKDWLLVEFTGPPPYWDNFVRLIDVPNERILYEYTASNRFQEPFNSSLIASARDGSSVYAYGAGIVQFGTDGSIRQWQSHDAGRSNFSGDRIMTSRYTSGQVQDRHVDLIITDLTDQETRVYKSFPYEVQIDNFHYQVVWNADRSFAIVEEFEYCGDYFCRSTGLALYDWESGIRYPLEDGYRLVETAPLNHFFVEDMWSPDGRAVMIYDNAIDRNLFVVDTLTRAIIPVNQNCINFQWVNEHDLWLTIYGVNSNGESSFSIHDFDWQNQTLSYLPDVSSNKFGVTPLRFSPDYTYIGYPQQNAHVQNLNTGEVFTYPRNEVTSDGGTVADYKWHESNQWFFAGSERRSTWLENDAITLYHLPESSGRDLTLCYTVATCTGFLPDHVRRYLTLP